MGVNFTAKGLPYEDEYDCGYITFGGYRKKLALALQPDYGLAYWAWYGGNGYEDDGERIISGTVPLKVDGREISECELVKIGFFDVKKLDGVGQFEGHWQVSMSADVLESVMNDHFTEAQINFLFAPDCEGKWPWKECRDMYKDMKDVKVDCVGHNYCEVGGTFEKPEFRTYNMHEQFMNMMRYCWKRRVNLTWS